MRAAGAAGDERTERVLKGYGRHGGVGGDDEQVGLWDGGSGEERCGWVWSVQRQMSEERLGRGWPGGHQAPERVIVVRVARAVAGLLIYFLSSSSLKLQDFQVTYGCSRIAMSRSMQAGTVCS